VQAAACQGHNRPDYFVLRELQQAKLQNVSKIGALSWGVLCRCEFGVLARLTRSLRKARTKHKLSPRGFQPYLGPELSPSSPKGQHRTPAPVAKQAPVFIGSKWDAAAVLRGAEGGLRSAGLARTRANGDFEADRGFAFDFIGRCS
jgi:hypothetical protein